MVSLGIGDVVVVPDGAEPLSALGDSWFVERGPGTYLMFSSRPTDPRGSYWYLSGSVFRIGARCIFCGATPFEKRDFDHINRMCWRCRYGPTKRGHPRESGYVEHEPRT